MFFHSQDKYPEPCKTGDCFDAEYILSVWHTFPNLSSTDSQEQYHEPYKTVNWCNAECILSVWHTFPNLSSTDEASWR